MKRPVLRPSRPAAWAIVAVCLGLAAVVALACDTPVYRYALERWEPARYQIVYFHSGPAPAGDQAVLKYFDGLSQSDDGANLFVTDVDLSRPAALEPLPAAVKKSWDAREKKDVPAFLVLSPVEKQVSFGPLELAAAKELVESPARKKIGQLLHEGHGAALILLSGEDAQANNKAEQVIRLGIADAAKGSADVKPITLGYFKLNRGDKNEKRLVEMLLAIDEVPAEKLKQPLLFAVFGRGRTMGPCPGDMLNAESLGGLVTFLGGACSCTIKDQNPGVDLLLRWNWPATIEQLATRDEQQEKALADQAVPAGDGPAAKPVAKPDAKTAEDAKTGSERKPEPAAAVAAPASEPPESKAEAVVPATGLAEAEPAAEEESPSFVARQLTAFAWGAGIAAAAVVALGVWFVRRAEGGQV